MADETTPKTPKRKGKRRLRAALLISLIPGIVGILLTYLPRSEALELRGLNFLFQLRGPLPPPREVCVVAIDDDSYTFRELDSRQTWPRGLHGELVRTLAEAGASAIAFDVLFEDPGDMSQDQAFYEGLLEAGNVVLGATVEHITDPRFRSATIRDPFEPFAEAAAATGDVGLAPDTDGNIRSTWPMRNDRPSLALAAYEIATSDYFKREEALHWIDYYGPTRTIPTVSLYQALEPEEYLPEGFFRDRVVFVGASEVAGVGREAKDTFLTPYREARGSATWGVEIHATIAANLLQGRQLRPLGREYEALLLLLLPMAASLVFMYFRPVWGGAALIGLTVVPWLAGLFAFTQHQLWIPVMLPTVVQLPLAYLISVLWYYLTTVRDRERIRRAFGFYLSPAMTDRIAEDPDSLNLGGEEIVATALFSDIQGFTSIAEGQRAPETAAMLNEYFSEITRHIFEADGTLIKYIGDAVFAIWGAPIYMEDHASRACRTALAMAKAREALAGTPAGELITRIGVHTGPMLVGNLGSKQRFDYTAIGDAVNLAARLEGLNKAFGTFTLASGDSFHRTDGSVIGRSLGHAQVVGRSEPVEIFELVGLTDDPTKLDPRVLERFGESLADYHAGRLDVAREGFRALLESADGRDGPTEFYLREIERHAGRPLPEDWNGTITFTKK